MKRTRRIALALLAALLCLQPLAGGATGVIFDWSEKETFDDESLPLTTEDVAELLSAARLEGMNTLVTAQSADAVTFSSGTVLDGMIALKRGNLGDLQTLLRRDYNAVELSFATDTAIRVSFGNFDAEDYEPGPLSFTIPKELAKLLSLCPRFITVQTDGGVEATLSDWRVSVVASDGTEGAIGIQSTRVHASDAAEGVAEGAAEGAAEGVAEGVAEGGGSSRAPSISLADITTGTGPLATLRWDGGYCGIFQSITCIGDDMTAGVYEHNEQGTEELPAFEEYSYPSYMGRTLGCTVYNLGVPGATAIRWLARSAEKGYFDTCLTDAYIIALGSNDIVAHDGGNITGSIADVNAQDASLTDTTTDVGAYAGIIQTIRQHMPRAAIFCVTIPHTRNTDATIAYANARIREVASLLSCHVIDLETYGVQSDQEAEWKQRYYTGGHPNTLGYRQLSVWMMSYIDYIIRNDPLAFTQTAFVDTEYEYVRHGS